MSLGRSLALPRLSSRAAIANASRCYLPISSASCGLADLDCAAREAHKISSLSAPSRRTFAGLPSSLLVRRQQQRNCVLLSRSGPHLPSIIGATENRWATAANVQPRKIRMLGATAEAVYQVPEFLKPFNFRSCNPRIPALPAGPAMVRARLGRCRPASNASPAPAPRGTV